MHIRLLISVVVLSGLMSSCTKTEPVRTRGIDTIDNIQYFSTTYFYYGFTFSSAKLVGTYPSPGPDITLYVNSDNPLQKRLTLQTTNLKDSFYKLGDFADEAEAVTAFKDLKTVNVTQWEGMADPISDNQVWIYRTGTDTYAKIRIISTINEPRDGIAYGECTFEWVYQPDGSLTFTGK